MELSCNISSGVFGGVFFFPPTERVAKGSYFQVGSESGGWTAFVAPRRERSRVSACVLEALCCWIGDTKSVSPCVSRGRFAWQAWGIVSRRAWRWIEGWRFAWGAWGSGCMSAVGKALDGGSPWQVWGIARFDGRSAVGIGDARVSLDTSGMALCRWD